MTLYILRHADKAQDEAFNPKLRHQDPPISARGRAQAEALVKYFENREISAIFISEYLRARQTAEPLASHLGIAPVVDARLNEIDIGVLEGLEDEEIASQYPAVWQAYIDRDKDFRFPQGETGEEAQARAADFTSMLKEHPGNILAVSHDGLIRALFTHVVGLPVYKRFDFQIQFCGLFEIDYSVREEKWKLVRFNQSTS